MEELNSNYIIKEVDLKYCSWCEHSDFKLGTLYDKEKWTCKLNTDFEIQFNGYCDLYERYI